MDRLQRLVHRSDAVVWYDELRTIDSKILVGGSSSLYRDICLDSGEVLYLKDIVNTAHLREEDGVIIYRDTPLHFYKYSELKLLDAL